MHGSGTAFFVFCTIIPQTAAFVTPCAVYFFGAMLINGHSGVYGPKTWKWIFWSPFRPSEITENPWKHSVFKGFNELVGQNCNSVKSRILCLRFINIEIIPLNTVLVNRFLKSFCKIIETMSYYFLYLMYKYRLKRGKPILSLSFYATSIFRNSSSAW